MNVDLEVNYNLQKNSLKQIDKNAKKKIDIDGLEENEGTKQQGRDRSSLNYTENR
jgi:hypothetical protein